MNRFFIETELTVGSTIQLTESVFHHWVRVYVHNYKNKPYYLMAKVVSISRH